jgi:hypothetical protein
MDKDNICGHPDHWIRPVATGVEANNA